jgi:CRP-like cAMP-binding protein
MENVKIEFLRNIPLFSALTDKELLQISNRVVIKEFFRNEIILQEEETNEFMYIVLFGKVKVVQITEEGKEIILAIHQSNDFFGELSLIDGRTSAATVLATKDSLVAIISKKNFYSLIFGQKKVLENLLRILCSRLRESWKRVHILNFRNAPQRIRMLFIFLSNETGKETQGGVLLNDKLTHQEIADMTGLTRETVTRVLSKWQRNGEISVLKNKFVRLNPLFFEKDTGSSLEETSL